MTPILLTEAFETMGHYLAEREVLGEIAVYGGTAILLQFAWRQTTQDVDAVVMDGRREGIVKDAAAYTALRLGLADEWLNNAVGAYTPQHEPDSFFGLYGSFPAGERCGLRIFLARPEYLCAMKLKALARQDVGDRDLDDVIGIAAEIGCDTAEKLERLFAAFFPDERLDATVMRRLPGVAETIRRQKRT